MECCPPLQSTRLDSGKGVGQVSVPSIRSLPAETHAPSEALQTLMKTRFPERKPPMAGNLPSAGNPIKPGACQIPAQSPLSIPNHRTLSVFQGVALLPGYGVLRIAVAAWDSGCLLRAINSMADRPFCQLYFRLFEFVW